VKCLCSLTDDELREGIALLVETYGDVPPGAIKPEDIDLKEWRFCCPDEENERVVSAGKMEISKTDWFSCTVKNLVTAPEYRSRNIATEIARGLLEDAIERDSCLVCQADITKDNAASRHIFEQQLGFKVVSDFCMPWEGKEAVVVQKDLSPREECENRR